MRLNSLRKIPLWGMIFLYFIFFTFSFTASTARMGGADEALHQATAWYDTSHLNVTTKYNTLVGGIPLQVASWPCFLFQTEKPSSCSLKPLPDKNGKMIIYNYFPLYYYFVGAGDRIGMSIMPSYAWVGGRVLGAIPGLVILIFLLRRLSRYKNKTVLLLPLLLFTPEFISLLGTANPNGLEIISAFWFFLLLLDSFQGKEVGRWHLLIAEFILIFSRPMGVVWVVLITVLILSYLLWGNKNSLEKFEEEGAQPISKKSAIITKLIPLELLGLFWAFLHPLNLIMPPAIRPIGFVPAQKIQFGLLPKYFLNSLELIPRRLGESYFMAGYKEIFAPTALVVTIGVTLLALLILTSRKSKNRLTLLLASIIFFIAMSLIEAHNWGKWPEFWLGRYQLPLLLPLIFLYLLKLTFKGIKILILLLTFFIFASTYSAYENLARYQVGIRGGLPNSFFLPVDLLSWVSLGCIILMLITGLLITLKTYQENIINGDEDL